MEELKRTLTREELHKLVWSTPIQKLAKQYGLSDRGFSKICQRHLVPVPPRGYWAKIEAGQPAKPTRLRPVKGASLQIVQITTKPANMQSDYLAEILSAAKLGASVPELKAPAPAVELAVPAKAPPLKATVKSHRDVAPFLAELRSLTPDRDGFIDLRCVKIPPAAVPRVGALLSVLTDQLGPYGFEFHDDGKTRLGFSKEGYVVDFRIDAPRKRVKASSDSWRLHDYQHVGRLDFKIYGDAKGTKSNWIDTDDHKVEDSIAQIIDSILIHHVIGKELEIQRKADQARRVHLAHRRELADLRAKREVKRLEFLRWIAEGRNEVDSLRATIAAVPQQGDVAADYHRMLEWAEKRLAALEDRTSVESIQSSLIEQNLYPMPDDLFDPEGDPPPKQNYWDD